MDTQMIVVLAIFIGGLAYETTMFLYNKWKKGEQFDLPKFAMTYGYVGILATTAYLVTGTFPQVSAIIAQLGESLPDPTVIFPALTALIMAFYQQGGKLYQSKFGGVQTTQPTQTPPIQQPEPKPFPVGEVKVLGIYGGSSKGQAPKPAFTCDVNQVPMMFFDFMGTAVGKIMFLVKIDNEIIADPVGWTLNQPLDQSKAQDFWVPQKFRTPGKHLVAVEVGHVPAQDKVVWDRAEVFSLEFTGVKPLE